MNEHRLDEEHTTSRRNFLKTTGAVTAGALAGSLLPETWVKDCHGSLCLPSPR